MKPKIMHILASKADGGAEKACEDIVKALALSGADQSVVMRKHPGRLKAFNQAEIPCKTLPFGGALDFVTPLALKLLIRRYQPDIIQTWLSRAARKLPSLATSKVAIVSRLGGYYALKNYRRTDYFIANTPDIRRYLIEKGIAPSDVIYIPNFATPGPETEPVKRSDFDTPENVPVFVCASRLHPDKGIDVFIRALAETPGTYGWVAGSGPEETRLKALARELGIQERIRFLGWQNNIKDIISSADIFVLASRVEPFGNAFLQGWACNRSVIASASKGPVQFIRDGKDGVIVPVDDSGALAQAMGDLAFNPEKRESIAGKGYERFVAEFSKERCINSYMSFYDRLYEEIKSGR